MEQSIGQKPEWLKEAVYDADHSTDDLVAVDLTTVTGIRSDDLNDLIHLNARLRHEGRHLVIENVQDVVWQVFNVTRLDRLFEIRRYASA